MFTNELYNEKVQWSQKFVIITIFKSNYPLRELQKYTKK